MRAKNNFYVVVIGGEPGIYNSWEECKLHVDGYSGAQFRGFIEYEDALKWQQRLFKKVSKNRNLEKFVYISDDDTWGNTPMSEFDDIYISIDWLRNHLNLSPSQMKRLLKGIEC